MISRSRSSDERSPPLASGWWRFTRALNRILISCGAGARSQDPVRPAPCARHCGPRGAPAGAAQNRPPAVPPIPGTWQRDRRHREPMSASPPGRLPDAHFPGRAMAGDGLLLISRDRIVAHAGEEIVRLVVFAHVRQTEAPIFLLSQPRPWARGGSPCRRSRASRRPGTPARSRRSSSGLTRMRSNRGELNFMTDDYA